ncbi:MAG: ATP-binding protein, partial [Desulfobacteraceae bacterium]
SVWNSQPIAPSITRRIFQRNFSTKNESGRGLGTYSMKLIGEQLLGGRVYFETSKQAGTSFFIELPARGPSRENHTPTLT